MDLKILKGEDVKLILDIVAPSESEYDPTQPNDYYKYLQKKENMIQSLSLKAKKERELLNQKSNADLDISAEEAILRRKNKAMSMMQGMGWSG